MMTNICHATKPCRSVTERIQLAHRKPLASGSARDVYAHPDDPDLLIKVIRKTAIKRDHKKLDYDRHRATLKKLQDKKDKTAKDEKAMWKAENDVEQSTQEFNYFNDLLKDELPKLFVLEREFIQPLFQSFYYMQLNIFYTLHEKMQQCDIGYFDLTADLEETFNRKREGIQEKAEALSIVKFKTTGQKRPPKYAPKPALEGSKPQALLTAGPSSAAEASASPTDSKPPSTLSARPAWQRPVEADNGEQAPPPYSPGANLATTPTSSAFRNEKSPVSPAFANGKPSNLAAAAAAKAKPPPPKPKPKNLAGQPVAEMVTALYDYSAQAEGDLSFRAGDVIEIVSRTQNDNEWWIGKLQGKQGQFPGMFCPLSLPAF